MSDEADAEIKKQIMALIQEADDPGNKALLLILYQINDTLTHNTAMTKTLVDSFGAYRKEFDAHEKTEMALINQGRGWIRSSLFFLGILQAIALALGAAFVGDHNTLEKRVGTLEQFAEGHRQHHLAEESLKVKSNEHR